MQLKFDEIWEGCVEIPPFKIKNTSAVELLCAVLDSAVGNHIIHSFSVSEAVAVQIGQLFLSLKDADQARTGLPAVCVLLAS
eukprot:934167-Pleurochrysis_carterae.AAC.3